MFGLSGLTSDREQNIRRLTDFPWIAIPIAYRNGTVGVITFEKGDEGERVIKEALRLWSSRS
jgi:hypothetical protein